MVCFSVQTFPGSLRHSRAATSAVIDRIWMKFEIIRDVMKVLVTSQNEEDPIKTEELNNGSSDIEHEEDFRQLTSNADWLKASMRNGGVRALTTDIEQKLGNWETEMVNIAVIGRTGVGKSTFINAIRGNVRPESKLFAPVGVIETTYKATKYPHPDNENLVFWDLPGAGTKTFPRNKYLSDQRVNFAFYDIYIILSSERFTEDETWLAEEISKLHKKFLFVRTKVDSDIMNDQLQLGEKADPLKVAQNIRENCTKNLKSFKGFDESRDLYLIGSLQPTHPLLDFGKLCIRMVDGLLELKGDALLFSLTNMAPEILEAKIKSLQKRIWGMGALSALSGSVPLPGVGLVDDTAMILREAHFYRKQLGITKSDLEEVAQMVGIPVEVLAEKYNIKTFFVLLPRAVLGMSALLLSEVIEIVAGLAIPVIGIISGGAVSFCTTVKILRGMLKLMEADAYIVLENLKEHTAGRVSILSKTSDCD